MLTTAQYISLASKDPSLKVGAVVTSEDGRWLSSGWNCFPTGIAEDHRIQDRNTKLLMINHAEIVAVLNLHRYRPGETPHTIYVWPMAPCIRCASFLIQAGVRKVVAGSFLPERWREECNLALEMFQEAGVEVEIIDGISVQF